MPIPQKKDNRGAKASISIPALIPVKYQIWRVNKESLSKEANVGFLTKWNISMIIIQEINFY